MLVAYLLPTSFHYRGYCCTIVGILSQLVNNQAVVSPSTVGTCFQEEN